MKKKKKKAQHLAEFEPTTTNMKAIAISAALQWYKQNTLYLQIFLKQSCET